MNENHQTTEQVLDLICSRRTCYRFLDKKVSPVEIDKLEKCLKAAIHAPNHKLTQPWRFWVLGDQTKQKLSHVYADNRASKKAPDSDCYQTFYDRAIEKFDKIPLVIMVGQVKTDNATVYKEDYAACSCAIQNFQLMAWQQKIGVQWSTGPIINDERTFEMLGIVQHEIELIGALYVGNIDGNCEPGANSARKSVAEVTQFTD